MSSGSGLSVPEPDIRAHGGRCLEGEIRCDVPGCTRLDGFGTKAALGSHRWFTHGLHSGETLAAEEIAAGVTVSGGLMRAAQAPPTARVKVVEDREEDEVAAGDEENHDDTTADEADVARWITVGLSDQDEIDTLDAWCFLHGVENANEYVTQLVNDALSQARLDPMVARAVALRREHLEPA